MDAFSSVTRRRFLTKAATGIGAGLAAPYMIPRSVRGANDTVVLGHIGVGNQGSQHLRATAGQTAAVCDVDGDRLRAAQGKVEAKGRKCQAYGDFRKLLEQKDVDAVVITTPDHWHALPTIMACQAGKDVYVEKPMTLTLVEGQRMIQAARRHKRIVQVGSMQRSMAGFREACELVRNGRIGEVKKVTVGISGVNFKGPAVPDCDPPAELDYDLWLGPAPLRPYNPKHVHYNFRFYWDHSGGQMTNWGAHHGDIAQWGLEMDESGPVEVEPSAKTEYNPDGWYEVPSYFQCTYQYANGVELVCGMKLPGGTTFEGTKGKVLVNRGRLKTEPADILEDYRKNGLRPDETHLRKSSSHFGNWFDCLKSRELPICDVAIGHRSVSLCHLGNIAVRLNRKVRWNPVKEQIIGDEEAAKWVTRAYRAPWKLDVA